ncbi:hypothetical protein ACWGCI_23265, partial [Streptomyces sp. NPDC054949]
RKWRISLFKTWREQYQANQEMKRRIELERWEQEKRWREEDRAAKRKVLQDNAVFLSEHNEHLKVAAGISYLTLVCHEDTWTFVATVAFGIWRPAWVTSVRNAIGIASAPRWDDVTNFTVDPNLPDGRITKLVLEKDGMQKVVLSGHNLVRILDTLREGSAAEDIVQSARCVRLYNRFAEFVGLVDPDVPAGQTTGVEFRIDDSLDAAAVGG